jgi:hypothetical protein
MTFDDAVQVVLDAAMEQDSLTEFVTAEAFRRVWGEDKTGYELGQYVEWAEENDGEHYAHYWTTVSLLWAQVLSGAASRLSYSPSFATVTK